MTTPLVTSDDLGTYLQQPNIDEDRADLILGYAQTLCESVVSPLPAGADVVILDVAARAFSNPLAATPETIGPYSVTMPGGLYLTTANKSALRRLSGSGGAFTIDTMPDTAGQNLPPWDSGNYYDGTGWGSW